MQGFGYQNTFITGGVVWPVTTKFLQQIHKNLPNFHKFKSNPYVFFSIRDYQMGQLPNLLTNEVLQQLYK
jgi:hypothetical protein